MTARIVIPGGKPHKYRAVATEYGGRKYPSKAQARRAAELDMLVLAGQVAWYLEEVPIMIGEPGVDRPYRVDFLVATPYMWADQECVIIHAEDVKGADTVKFRRNVRQWRLHGPFDLHVIRTKGTEVIPGGKS